MRQLLADIHRKMVEEPATKDVFRELDGFLVITSLLSSLRSNDEEEADSRDLIERMEVARLALAITSEAMMDHTHNRDYFEVR